MGTPSTEITIGQEVRVAREQRRLGKPKYPGRTGRVVRLNSIAGADFGGLWYVQLYATSRAKAREETFWGEELEPNLDATA